MKPETQIVGVAVMSRATKMALCLLFVALAAAGSGLAIVGAFATIGAYGNQEALMEGAACIFGGAVLLWIGIVGVRKYRPAFETPIAEEMESAAQKIVKTREAAMSFKAAAAEAAKKAGLQ